MRAAVLPLLLLLAVPAAAQPPDVESDIARIAGAMLAGNQTIKLVEELVDRHGPRVTGSPAHRRSAEWAVEKFKSFGLEARIEPFAMPNLWQRGTARAKIVGGPDLRVDSLGWSPSTPRGGVRGELVVWKELTTDAVRKADLRGKILLVAPPPVPPGQRPSPKQFLERVRATKLLQGAGVLAYITPRGGLMNGVMDTGTSVMGGMLAPLPMAAVSVEDTRLLERRAEAGKVTVELELVNRTSGPGQAPNVIAELRGGERPDEWILIGAHLDSWDFAQGAQDDGAGVAQVLETARVLAQLGRPPRRSIRFALWGGEEEGIVGSFAWAQAHAAELAGCVAVLNTDNGAGHPRGWKVEGRPDVEAGLAALRPQLAGLGGDVIERTFSYDTDHGPFVLAGVPAIDLLVEPGNYGEIHHKPGDTLDKITPHALNAGATVVAATAWLLAQGDKPLAPRLDHAAVDKLLSDQDYAGLLREFGYWK